MTKKIKKYLLGRKWFVKIQDAMKIMSIQKHCHMIVGIIQEYFNKEAQKVGGPNAGLAVGGNGQLQGVNRGNTKEFKQNIII